MPDKRFANKRTKIQRERDELTIAELHLKGWSQRQIADYLELDPALINRTVKKIKQQWAKERTETVDLIIKQDLKKLAMLEVENWKAWERSQGTFESTSIEKLASGKSEELSSVGRRVKSIVKSEQKVGDVQFLAEIRNIVKDRAKLLGITDNGKIQLVAEQHATSELAMMLETIASAPNLTEDEKRKMLETIAGVSERAAIGVATN